MNCSAENSDQSFVGALCLSISLGIVRCRENLFDVVFLEQFCHVLVGKKSSIIGDNVFRDTESTYYVFLDEGCNVTPVVLWRGITSTHLVKYSVAVMMYSCCFEDAGLIFVIQSPAIERPWTIHRIKWETRSVDEITMDLAMMTPMNVRSCIVFHGRPIIFLMNLKK